MRVIHKNLPEPVLANDEEREMKLIDWSDINTNDVDLNMKCCKCKAEENVKLYVIADDLENPVPYCDKCWKDFELRLLIELSKENFKWK